MKEMTTFSFLKSFPVSVTWLLCRPQVLLKPGGDFDTSAVVTALVVSSCCILSRLLQ